MSQRHSHEEIERRERALLEELPFEAEHVPDSVNNAYDAELLEPFEGGGSADLSLVGALRIPTGTPLELKTCQRWIDDSGSWNGRRRGTFRIQQGTHEELVEAGGWYCLLVMDVDEILGGRLMDAEMLELCVTSWTNGGTKYRSPRAHLSWGSVMPTDAVGGGAEA